MLNRFTPLCVALLVGCANVTVDTNSTGTSDPYLNSIYERYGYDGSDVTISFEERVRKQDFCEQLGLKEYGEIPSDTLRNYRYVPKIDRCLLASWSFVSQDGKSDSTYRILDVETNHALFYYYYSEMDGYTCMLSINGESIGEDVWGADSDEGCPDRATSIEINNRMWKELTK